MEPATIFDGDVDLTRDRDLVRRCQAGDDQSFAELYELYHRRLFRLCARRLGSRGDAADATQEAFARAWRAMPRFGGERRFYPWLTVIAMNVCTDILRGRARVVPMSEMPLRAPEPDTPDVDERLLRQAEFATATEALTHLSERHRRVLRLRERTGWSAQMIADSEGVAVPAVDTLLWRARQALKREFALLSEGGGLAGVVGFSVAALHRAAGRLWSRASSLVPTPIRGPGATVAAVALVGAAVTGGGVAFFGASPARPHATERASIVAPLSGPARNEARATSGTNASSVPRAPSRSAPSPGTATHTPRASQPTHGTDAPIVSQQEAPLSAHAIGDTAGPVTSPLSSGAVAEATRGLLPSTPAPDELGDVAGTLSTTAPSASASTGAALGRPSEKLSGVAAPSIGSTVSRAGAVSGATSGTATQTSSSGDVKLPSTATSPSTSRSSSGTLGGLSRTSTSTASRPVGALSTGP